MNRLLSLLLAGGSALFLTGCVASMAASAIGMAAQTARGHPASNEHLHLEASEACSAAALKYGTVQVIDVEQRTSSRIVVWGTVQNDKQRRSFECSYGTKIQGFKLVPIKPRP
jgi:hypothetical protein